MTVATILKPAVAYFGIVFGGGFVLGTVRTLWVVPRVGARTAELLELPLMLLVVFLAARWLVRRFDSGRTPGRWFAIGLVALVLLLAAEVVLGLVLRGVSATEALVKREPVSGSAYYAAVGVFAVARWLLGGFGRKWRLRQSDDLRGP